MYLEIIMIRSSLSNNALEQPLQVARVQIQCYLKELSVLADRHSFKTVFPALAGFQRRSRLVNVACVSWLVGWLVGDSQNHTGRLQTAVKPLDRNRWERLCGA